MSTTTPDQQAQRQPPPPPSGGEQAALAALVLIFLSGMAPELAAAKASRLAAELGVDAAALATAVKLLGPHSTVRAGRTDPRMKPATAWVQATGAVRRAEYTVAAARRQYTVSPENERRWMQQHLSAERVRHEAAAKADTMVGLTGSLTLGWYATLDGRTTRGCAAMHGHNFDAADPPVVEGRRALPGGVHPACRCLPGPAHPVREPTAAKAEGVTVPA